MPRTTAATAALLLALLALSCMAQARTLQKSQADRDAEALAEQQAQQDALVADQAEREAELLRKQVEAQDRKNRAAGAGGSASSDDESSGDGGEQSSGSKGSSSSQDGQGCTKPDYSGMSRKEKRAAKKAYNKCRSAARSGDSTSYDSIDGSSGDGSGDSGAVTTKSLKRGGKGVRATYHYYSPAYETSSLYCADAFRGKESSLLGRPWTAYCAESILGPMSRDKCGRCIRVTNLATGDSIEATVVDMCGTGGMDLDPEAFNPIDSNGAGVRDGHMMVTVEWC
ncbi:hypothetical protein COHA_000458 [Chlorella ohadii]|uniref:Barwin domain-containing protein n=1 Tax=Chlorella ohadii TaxID=2649997 RepID=A0AAD5DWU3_9CHLO|nr:hypothetical protein COHA_000458 [Chlorella ohadii]